MTDLRSACAHYLQNADSFEPATASDAEDREPCVICFPGGEVDVEPAELVVVDGHCRNHDPKIHRTESSGEVTWRAKGGSGVNLRDRLLAMDPDEVGGGA